MNEFVLGGPITSALTHFAGLGLASILASAGARGVALRWTDGAAPRLHICSDFTEEQVGQAVRAHAEAAAGSTSWLNACISTGSRTGVRLYSPRFKPPEAVEEWEQIAVERDAQFPQDQLAAAMVVGLGEPAWWRQEAKGSPDAGASRWEMKTRNKGQEMLADRLDPLAREIAGWTAEGISSGLAGRSISDAVGNNSPISRTASGFTTPGPTDNALAWVALWGISATRPVRRAGGMAQTSGCWPRHRTHPQRAALPVWTSPVSLAVVRSTLASAAFDTAVFGTDELEKSAARARLVTWGVRGFVEFPILTTGSSSAPERQVLDGELVPLVQQ